MCTCFNPAVLKTLGSWKGIRDHLVIFNTISWAHQCTWCRVNSWGRVIGWINEGISKPIFFYWPPHNVDIIDSIRRYKLAQEAFISILNRDLCQEEKFSKKKTVILYILESCCQVWWQPQAFLLWPGRILAGLVKKEPNSERVKSGHSRYSFIYPGSIYYVKSCTLHCAKGNRGWIKLSEAHPPFRKHILVRCSALLYHV